MTDPPDSTVVVATYMHRHQAELARGFLSDAGIPAIVAADDGGGAFGAPLTFSGGAFATVAVREEDAGRARGVLDDAGVLPDDAPRGGDDGEPEG